VIFQSRKGTHRMRKLAFYYLGEEQVMLGYCPRPRTSKYYSPRERNQGDDFYICHRMSEARKKGKTAQIIQFPISNLYH